jgi:predicted ATP-dependent serine protease
LFADTNVGKSILAVQIANLIAGLQPVLYFDFELSDKQFEARYSKEYTDHYQFSNHFYRAEIDPDGDFEGFDSFEDYLIHFLEKTIVKAGIKILIIDNITYLKNETEKAKYALPLMKQLKALKKKYGLSILVLAHTPKRDLSKPITQNDLQGSKMLINFCDSAFAIGASQVDSNIRYLKQIKQRNTEQLYGADNVMVFQIVKPSNYLFMEFIGYNSEREHLKIFTERDREKMIEETKLLSSKGKSQRQIAAELRISLGAVNKYLNKTP